MRQSGPVDANELLGLLLPGDLEDLIPPRPEWHSRAECRGMDQALFFPARGGEV